MGAATPCKGIIENVEQLVNVRDAGEQLYIDDSVGQERSVIENEKRTENYANDKGRITGRDRAYTEEARNCAENTGNRILCSNFTRYYMADYSFKLLMLSLT